MIFDIGIIPLVLIGSASVLQALAWHPDRHTDDKNHATARFVEINNAYRIIMRERHFELANVSVHDLNPSRPSLHTRRSSEHKMPGTPRTSTFGTLSSSSRQSSFESVPSTPSCSRFSVPYSSTSSDTLPSTAPASSHPHPRVIPPQSITNVLESHHFRRTSTDSPIFPGRFTDSPLGTKSPSLPRPARRSTDGSSFSDNFPMKRNVSFRNTTSPSEHSHPPPPPPRAAYNPPVASIGLGTSKEWKYSLTLTLEELFAGRIFPIRITRHLLSGQRMNVVLDVDVPPGCQPETEIIFRGVGHERGPGRFQDIVFVVQQAHHDRFIRSQNDLLIDVKVLWTESLQNQDGRLCFPGIDGQLLSIRIPRPTSSIRGALIGSQTVQGAGMPIWLGDKVVGRGNLSIRWEVQIPHVSRWESIRSTFGFARR
ncbi:hypothetical protein D9757_009323 [Collybiopsis confluens]|uniref:Chaperone DnaJ C-terminal domain-containing protein n=1 Tax=Collybiopsis confluens TaxID=2823264 RepID=A0A8H5H3N6_9AGAR|nr:hypothetical protein D9757_009323 [Collybiopsis confluens]